MKTDRPLAAHIILKSSKEKATSFISLAPLLYQENLIFAHPKELIWNEDQLLLRVTFRDHLAFEHWQSNARIQALFQQKFDELLSAPPQTRPLHDLMIESDEVVNCSCEAHPFLILQGRSFQFMDELTCGGCLDQVSYRKIPTHIALEAWQNYHERFYLNWLDSGIFEADALAELTNYQLGKLNQMGFRLRAELENFFGCPVYIQLFEEESGFHQTCPRCGSAGSPSVLSSPAKSVLIVKLHLAETILFPWCFYVMTEAIHQHLSESPILEELIPDLNIFPFVSTQNVFHDLMSCILEQQIHYRSTKHIFASLLTRAKLKQLTPDNFSEFEATVLSHATLSRAKGVAIASCVHFFETRQLDWQQLTDEEVRQQLGSIRGVGDWTIDMILLFTLQRPDIFPTKDYHLKRIMMDLYELENGKSLAKEMEAIAAEWTPYRSFGVRYLLAWKKANSYK